APPGTPAGSLSAAFSAIGRLAISPLAPRNRIAVVSARGRPGSWFRGSTQVQIVNEGRGSFIVRPGAPIACAARALGTLVGGLVLSLRLAAAPVAPALVPPAPASRRRTPVDDGAAPFASPGPEAQSPAPGTLAIVVLSYNRYAALERTLNALGSFSSLKGAEVLVVDNGSTDGTPARLAAEFPQVRLLALEKNIGVAAFNRAAEHCAADYLLILDDDAVPDEAALHSAIGLLGRRPGLGAVTLHPRHPATGQSEWRFAASVDPARGRDDWPVMGCANLVRRDAWTRAGGYAESFFLYRNDTDLALKILALGMGVHFNPAWVAWHDSPAAAKKSSRWHRLATRNWVWLARRHCGAGLRASVSGVFGALFGWLWAHRLAGLSVPRHLATIQGLWEGLAKRPAPAPPTSGAPWRSLLRLRLGRSEK
ncbi:MAG TPA: glycosyltransferase family 2 protein, partial [Phycisphaerales bacterium]|nr:glycosyltransferase family 2 protein [Phycisphaerales bacterium]